MTSLPPHRTERADLCDLFVELGPDVPTLCEGWDTVDLAVHLVVRERKPLAAPGIMLGGPFASVLERTSRDMKADHPFDDLVRLIRTGPPFGPLRWLDGLINTQEYFVHHEDARRGHGDTTPRPEAQIAPVEAALWDGLRRSHRFVTRQIKGVRVDLVNTIDPERPTIHSGRGGDVVAIVGRPGEIILYLLGRTTAAHVELDGSDDAVAILTGTDLGI
jgi:uncharacterized protein (TIGR03085 family)